MSDDKSDLSCESLAEAAAFFYELNRAADVPDKTITKKIKEWRALQQRLLNRTLSESVKMDAFQEATQILERAFQKVQEKDDSKFFQSMGLQDRNRKEKRARKSLEKRRKKKR